MALLMIERGDQIDTIPLGKEETVLGGDPGCQVRIAGDRVAARHCRLLFRDGRHVLQNLQDRSSVTVNGKPVSEQPLKDGDEIEIGAVNLVFVGDTTTEEPDRAAAPTPAKAGTAAAPRSVPAPAEVKAAGTPSRGIALPAAEAALPPTGRIRKTGTQRRRAGMTSVRKVAATQTATRAAPAGADDGRTMMWIGIGIGGVLLLVLLAVAGTSGSSRGHGGLQAEAELNRLMAQVSETLNRGDTTGALAILENEILLDDRYKRLPRVKECRQLRDGLKNQMVHEREGVAQAEAFRKKIEEAKKNATAFKRSREFMEECDRLLARYGTTAGAGELRDIKEDLRRWIATDSQSDWQDEYPRVRDRVKTKCLEAGNFGQAVLVWKRFGEKSEDPLLRSRITSEIDQINKAAVAEATRIVGETSDRSKLEEAAARFTGTAGHAIIMQKLQSLK